MTCKTCIHLRGNECRKNPPIADNAWPKVADDGYCSQHKSAPKSTTKSTRVPTTEAAKRIATLFGRKLTTEWSDREIRAFKSCGTIEPADMAAIESYYASERGKGEKGLHRRDLGTFLNNFAGELDRARASMPKAQTPAQEPQGWREWMESKAYPYAEYAKARGYMKEEFQKQRQSNSNHNTTKTETKQ